MANRNRGWPSQQHSPGGRQQQQDDYGNRDEYYSQQPMMSASHQRNSTARYATTADRDEDGDLREMLRHLLSRVDKQGEMISEQSRMISEQSRTISEQSRKIDELSLLLAGGGSPMKQTAGGLAASGIRIDPNVRYCHLCDVTYNEQITLEHVEGKRHKQHLLRLVHDGNWDELAKQREIARRANAPTPENLYGPEPHQHGNSHRQPQGSFASARSYSYQQQQPHSEYEQPRQTESGGYSSSPSGGRHGSPPAPSAGGRAPSPRRPPLFDPNYFGRGY